METGEQYFGGVKITPPQEENSFCYYYYFMWLLFLLSSVPNRCRTSKRWYACNRVTISLSWLQTRPYYYLMH